MEFTKPVFEQRFKNVTTTFGTYEKKHGLQAPEEATEDQCKYVCWHHEGCVSFAWDGASCWTRTKPFTAQEVFKAEASKGAVMRNVATHQFTNDHTKACQMFSKVKSKANWTKVWAKTDAKNYWRQPQEMEGLCARSCATEAGCQSWQLTQKKISCAWYQICTWKRREWTCSHDTKPLELTTLAYAKDSSTVVVTKCEVNDSESEMMTTVQSGSMYKGTQVKVLPKKTLAQCQHACESDEKCEKWSLNQSTCELFDASAKLEEDAHSWAYVAGHSLPLTGPETERTWKNLNFGMFTNMPKVEATKEACENACYHREDCKAWNFADKMCKFSGSYVTPKDLWNAVYSKRGTAANMERP